MQNPTKEHSINLRKGTEPIAATAKRNLGNLIAIAPAKLLKFLEETYRGLNDNWGPLDRTHLETEGDIGKAARLLFGEHTGTGFAIEDERLAHAAHVACNLRRGVSVACPHGSHAVCF